MTDRGLPIVDGAPACPFVAFDDDRDARATSADHRHRCYAEVRPAPRALAHQEAYCLSSAFPVCPTFQDWAKREAAQARSGLEPVAPSQMPLVEIRAAHEDDRPGVHRNPPRNWAAPPPWLTGSQRESAGSDHDDEDEPSDVAAVPPGQGGGLSGSFADRLLGDAAPGRPAPPTSGPDGPDATAPPAPAPAPADRSRAGSAPRRRDRDPGVAGPSWERPHRREAYPTLRARIGLPSLVVPPMLLAVGAVIIAAVALFFLPALLGVGNPPASSSAPKSSPLTSPAAATSTAGEPTAVPQPTPQIYLVQSGDTMSRIANRFGVPLQLLIDANKETIPNPDVLDIGQEVIIPSVAPTSLPDSPSVTEVPSTQP